MWWKETLPVYGHHLAHANLRSSIIILVWWSSVNPHFCIDNIASQVKAHRIIIQKTLLPNKEILKIKLLHNMYYIKWLFVLYYPLRGSLVLFTLSLYIYIYIYIYRHKLSLTLSQTLSIDEINIWIVFTSFKNTFFHNLFVIF